MTSQSAEAFLALYRLIFRVAEADTGLRVRFRHLHGEGYEIWTGDEDRGHALGVSNCSVTIHRRSWDVGLGELLVELALGLLVPDPHEPSTLLCALGPYDHLARFFRLCVVHFKRNVKKLQGKVTAEVYNAMWTLAGTERHTDFEAACTLIRAGGRDAASAFGCRLLLPVC